MYFYGQDNIKLYFRPKQSKLNGLRRESNPGPASLHGARVHAATGGVMVAVGQTAPMSAYHKKIDLFEFAYVVRGHSTIAPHTVPKSISVIKGPS